MTSRVILLITALFLTTFQSFSQIVSASDKYPNGQLRFKGKFVVCSTRDKKFPMVEIFEKRKFGKWIAYNSNGTIKEIREYTKKGKDCNTKILRKGEWQYFNQNGEQYLTELYTKDTLVYSELDIYENDSFIGKIIKTSEGFDTFNYISKEPTDNLIVNPSFDQYFFKPIQIENNGKDQIENLVPYWYSPDKATPDYYNNYRSVNGIPNHLNSSVDNEDYNGYLGLMLYLNPIKEELNQSVNYSYVNKSTLQDYRESIQAKLNESLTKNKTYCFKVNILLSRNAGYSIDRFGVLFTSEPIFYDYFNPPIDPTLSFKQKMNNSDSWKTFCKGFVAQGTEVYITLGRFSLLEDTNVIKQDARQQSQLDVNKSAYYLIDDLQLYEVNSTTACGCSLSEQLLPETQEPINFDEVELDQKITGNRFILSNILFGFDRAEIKNSFIPELQKLLDYLEQNISVNIKIKGYTDNIGAEGYNTQLSYNRAKVIALWLIDNGIDAERISAEGFGSSEPLVNNSSDTNRKINRRVEIVIFWKD